SGSLPRLRLRARTRGTVTLSAMMASFAVQRTGAAGGVGISSKCTVDDVLPPEARTPVPPPVDR
ncbi:MAG TPA: hypothetical protein VK428_03260, partial [Acidimicrobiales bacterium]|nr:hypothetical protein [Acidimicrobiales bacterium]